MKIVVKVTIWGWYQACMNVVNSKWKHWITMSSKCKWELLEGENSWFNTQFVEYQKVQMKLKYCHQTTLKDEGVMLNQWTIWASICWRIQNRQQKSKATILQGKFQKAQSLF